MPTWNQDTYEETRKDLNKITNLFERLLETDDFLLWFLLANAR